MVFNIGRAASNESQSRMGPSGERQSIAAAVLLQGAVPVLMSLAMDFTICPEYRTTHTSFSETWVLWTLGRNGKRGVRIASRADKVVVEGLMEDLRASGETDIASLKEMCKSRSKGKVPAPHPVSQAATTPSTKPQDDMHSVEPPQRSSPNNVPDPSSETSAIKDDHADTQVHQQSPHEEMTSPPLVAGPDGSVFCCIVSSWSGDNLGVMFRCYHFCLAGPYDWPSG